jgi:hypothetical protein
MCDGDEGSVMQNPLTTRSDVHATYVVLDKLLLSADILSMLTLVQENTSVTAIIIRVK